jgi:O-Antigen ligase
MSIAATDVRAASELDVAPRDGRSGAVVMVALAIAFLPWLKPAGPGNTSPVDPLVFGAIAATLWWLVASRRPVMMPYAVGMGCLALAGSLASVFGSYQAQGPLAVAPDVLVLALGAAVANVCQDPATLRVVLRVWIGTAVVWAGVLVVGALTKSAALAGWTASDGSRASLTFGDPNMAASYFVTAVFVLLAMHWPRGRALRGAGLVLLLMALVLTGSNGVLVALVVGILVALALRVAENFGPVGLVLFLVLVAALGAATWHAITPQDVQREARNLGQLGRDSVGRSEQSEASRATLYHEVLALYREGPLLGRGPSTTKRILADQQADYVKEAHSDFTATLAERGALGEVGLVVLAAGLAVRAATVVRRSRPPAVAVAVPRPAWLVGALCAVAISAAFYEVLHFRHAWVLFGVVAALAKLTLEPRARDSRGTAEGGR